jgi:phosphotransferase system HPr (HPr) family protein
VNKLDHSNPGKAIGDVIVSVASGLSSGPARQITGQARRFQCSATLANGRGEVADARSLFELLSLGAGPGERVTIRCHGSDAHAAYQAIAEVLAGPPTER